MEAGFTHRTGVYIDRPTVHRTGSYTRIKYMNISDTYAVDALSRRTHSLVFLYGENAYSNCVQNACSNCMLQNVVACRCIWT